MPPVSPLAADKTDRMLWLYRQAASTSALSPLAFALVVDWANPTDFLYFREQFGIGLARLVTKFPQGWEFRIVKAGKRLHGTKDATRLELLLKRLKEVSVDRPKATWDPSKEWLENAQVEHHRVPFDAILARDSGQEADIVVRPNEIDDDNPRWRCPHGVVLGRQASSFSEALGVLLRSAKSIHFVDPHLSPAESNKKTRSLREFLRVVAERSTGNPPDVVEVQMSSAKGGRSQSDFSAECEVWKFFTWTLLGSGDLQPQCSQSAQAPRIGTPPLPENSISCYAC